MYGELISTKETIIEIPQKIYLGCFFTNIHGFYYCYFIYFQITQWSCGLCNGEFMSPRKTVIRRNLIAGVALGFANVAICDF